MKILIKYILIFSFLKALLFAGSFINEPILNSQVYVDEFGNRDKEAIVFVHGLGDEASTIWQESIDKLKDDYYILTFDLPGFGKSAKLNKEYTPKNYALVIDYLVKKYVNKPFYLIGHSMGAAISIKYTSMYQSKVKRLMLIDAAGILQQDAYSNFLVKMGLNQYFKSNTIKENSSGFFSSLTNIVQKFIPDDLSVVLKSETLRDYVLQSNPTAIAAIGLVMEDFNYAIRSLDVETFILWGEKDSIAPLRTGHILNKLIKNSNMKVIKNSKHVPIIDSKKEYMAYLYDFLAGKKNQEKEKISQVNFDSLIIEKQKNTVISGTFDSLVIMKSKNITISNAVIKSLTIVDSSVKINNSIIYTNKTNIFVQSSRVQITASDIKGKDGFYALSSNVDLAGVDIDVQGNAFKGLRRIKRTKVVFSVSNIDSNVSTNRNIHKSVILNYKDTL